ncbi:unnamed protein product [Bursaphelenchus xylophilus]|uniref:(pine wood nematode) hypothetical protein n=1 Tax=Bursaphelenchus xylophilus TaxID=6326 RepID=A0A1I7SAW9_BURXY|nr:unnamed protein product [Bursaphelenchus xylophilus]CAG9106134.1 unnamed protein product [Bursaphelenchus xylophilus]
MLGENKDVVDVSANLMPRRLWSVLMSAGFLFALYLIFSSVSGSEGEREPTFMQNNVKHDPDLSYGIVIDAGSTGSRLFLYAFTSGTTNELISVKPVKDEFGADVVKKVSPGLSSFEKNPNDAPGYYKPLLDFASKYIPYEMQPFTPVFIFATAGMRLLPQQRQDEILRAVRTQLPSLTRLQVLPEHIQVIDGKWEGIYSWIAVNYVLGRFNLREDVTHSSIRDKTAGMIDMGGASVQIAFELPQDTKFNAPALEQVNLGALDDDAKFKYNLFVTTFLGFGVNEGAKKYDKEIDQKMVEKLKSANGSDVPSIKDDCLPLNYIRVSSLEDGSQFVKIGTGNWDGCVSSVVKVIKEAGDCSTALKCFFGGVSAPSVDLSSIELYGFSEYWYSSHDVLSLGGRYDHDQFEKMARKYCSTSWKSIRKTEYSKIDVTRLEAQCFKSAWIHAILHDGFHVNELNNQFQSALKIRSQEVQWALGALIYQMRYFPLKQANRENIKAQHIDSNSSTFYPIVFILALLVVIAILVLIVTRQLHKNNASGLPAFKRDPSGYKKLNTEDYFMKGVRSSPTLYRGSTSADGRFYP